jgi:hypothetical protein
VINVINPTHYVVLILNLACRKIDLSVGRDKDCSISLLTFATSKWPSDLGIHQYSMYLALPCLKMTDGMT